MINGFSNEFLCFFFFLQVETVGQVYMVVSGAPETCENHTQSIADAALAMLKSVTALHLPHALNVRVKIGIFFWIIS